MKEAVASDAQVGWVDDDTHVTWEFATGVQDGRMPVGHVGIYCTWA